MVKAGISILFCLLVLSCNRDKKKVAAFNRIPVFKSLVAEKKYEAALNVADSILLELENNSDSLSTYIKWNADLYDSAKSWKSGDSVAEKYYYNIIAKSNLLQTDTALNGYLATAWYRIGINHYSQTRYSDTAMQAWENYLLLNEKLPERQIAREFYVKGRLGILYNIAGDMIKSLHYYSMVVNNFNRLKDGDNATAFTNNKAIAYNELRLYDSTINDIALCSTFEGTDPGIRALQYALLAEAEMQKGKMDDCEKSINKSILLVNTIRDTSATLADRKSQIYFIKYKIAKKQNNLPAATAAGMMSLNFEAANDDPGQQRQLAKRMIAMGIIMQQMQQYDSAGRYFQQALAKVIAVDKQNVFSLPVIADLSPENTILEALDAKANLLQLLFEQKPDITFLQTAVDCYALSFEVEKKLMSYFSYDESKLFMLAESRHRSQKAISLCYQLYQRTKNILWAEKAFQFAEKSKAFVLLESVKRNLASNSVLQNDTLYKNVQHLQLQLAYIERSLAEATADSAKQKLQQQKTKLNNELLLANTALGRQSIAYKTVMEKEDSISATSVSANLLNEKTGLIEFFNADTVTYAFVLNKKLSIQFIKYDKTLSASIDSMVTFFSSPSAIGNNPQSYQQAAHQLYKELQFDKLDKGWQKLIIIPDGKLSFLPFDALITNETSTLNLQQAAYFINQCNTLYGYSAAILSKQLNNNQSQYNSTTVFAPVFLNNENHQQPLLYSQQEAEAIGLNKNTSLFVKEQSTLNNFRQQFANTGILHIATHAYADTGLSSNPKIEFIDSSLLLNELYAMQTRASLVVLSACETGIGRLNSSEGPMSLARGFYYAGAKNVITSYWNVDDKSTALLFKSFYQNVQGSPSDEAIYLAKKELLKNENGKFASPYYWAGFVHFGMPQKKESRNYWWWLLLVPVIAFVVYRQRYQRNFQQS